MDAKHVFEILVREHAGMLDIFLRGAVRDPGLADDLFQETVVRAWSRLDAFDTSRAFGPWLRGIARRLILESARRNPRWVALDSEEALEALNVRCEQLHQRTNGAQSGGAHGLRLEILGQCIERLDDPYRSAIRARYAENLRGVPLAERLATGAENARKLVQRARRLLAECIERGEARGDRPTQGARA